jgi:hypothetical protein
MKKMSFSFVIVAASLLAIGFALGCGSAAVIKGGVGTALGLVTITNSGSTNSSGYTVKVYPNGEADIAISRPPSARKASVPRTMASDLFGAVHAAQSNGQASGAARCMKSASFGSTMRVKYSTRTSPDLNCPVSGTNAALRAQVNKILATVKVWGPVGNMRTLPVNEPRRMEPTPVSSPAPVSSP